MANNVQATAGSGTTFKTTDNAGVHTGHVNVDTIVPGTGATSLGKAEDAAHSSGDTGVMVLSVRQDTAAALGGTDADYQPLITDASGRLHVNAGAVGAIVPGTGATNLGKAIDTATGGTDTGVLALVTRDDALSTLTPADGDNTQLRVTSTGALWVQDASLNSNGQATAANSSPTVMASDRMNSVAFSVAMSADTNVYASGDLIADTQQLDAFFNKTDGRGVVNSITIIDQDNQGAAIYIMFHSTTTSMGSENSAPNISDANLAAGLLGIVAVATTDYVTVSGAKVACIKNIGLPVKAVSGTDDLYVSVLNSTGTPTYTASGLNLTIGALLD